MSSLVPHMGVGKTERVVSRTHSQHLEVYGHCFGKSYFQRIGDTRVVNGAFKDARNLAELSKILEFQVMAGVNSKLSGFCRPLQRPIG